MSGILSTTTQNTTENISKSTEDGTGTTGTRRTSSSTTTQDLGDRVVDVSLQPYARQLYVKVELSNMRPDTDYIRIYFNDEPLDQLDSEIYFSNFVNNQGDAIGSTENWDQWKGSVVTDSNRPSGSQSMQFIKTDSNGQATFGIQVPANTFVGDSSLLAIEEGDILASIGGKDTRAYGTYRAHGLRQAIESTIISTQIVEVHGDPPPPPEEEIPNPDPNNNPGGDCGETTTEPLVSERSQLTGAMSIPIPNTSPQQWNTRCIGGSSYTVDPLAQSFKTYSEPVYISSIDLYFKTKATSGVGITVQFREMINGYPGPKIIPGSTVTLLPSSISTSTDATTATRFTFNDPVYLEANIEYCFVVLAYSTEYELWSSELGQLDSISGNRIDKQPVYGSLFTSQNNSTWTAEQNYDLKFKINKCNFSYDGSNEFINFKAMTGSEAFQLIQYTSQMILGTNQIVQPSTDIRWYYKFDETASGPGSPSLGLTSEWRLFEPGINVDLQNLTTQVLLRMEFAGGTLTPLIDKERCGFLFLKNLNRGVYMTRTVDFSAISPENLRPDYLRGMFSYKLPTNCQIVIYAACNDDLDNANDINWHEVVTLTSSGSTNASETVNYTLHTDWTTFKVSSTDYLNLYTGQSVTLSNFSTVALDNDITTFLSGTTGYINVISTNKFTIHASQSDAISGINAYIDGSNSLDGDTVDVTSGSEVSYTEATLPAGWKEASFEYNMKGLLTSQNRDGVTSMKLKIEMSVDSGYEAQTPLIRALKLIATKRST